MGDSRLLDGMRIRVLSYYIAVLVIAAAAILAACGQSGKGGLSAVVFVYDENRAVIPEAQVEITASSPELALKGETGTAGTIAFTGLTEDEFRTVAGLDVTDPQAEYRASKDKYLTLSASISGGDYVADNLKRGGRVHIEITLARSEVDDPSWTPTGGSTAVQTVEGTAPLTEKTTSSPDGTLWAIGTNGIVSSTDQGISWSQEFDPSTLGMGLIDLTDIAFQSVEEGWVAGTATGSRTGVVLHTVDGGVTWSQLEAAECPLLAVAAVGPGNAWVTGCGVFRAEGERLTAVRKMPEVFEYYDVAATGFGEAWVLARAVSSSEVGPATADVILTSVYHTNDGGNTWDVQYRSDTTVLNSVTISSDGRGSIAGDNGLALSLRRTSKAATPTPMPGHTPTPGS
jgi:hypothetical protein